MAIGTSDKSEFVAAVSALVFALQAGSCGPVQMPLQAATNAVSSAETLWAALQAKGYIEQERA